MPFNGSGVFTNVYNWTQDKINGIKIRADRMDAQDDGIATGLSTCITRDGQSPPTANIPMGNFRLTGLGAATALTDAMQLKQFQNNDGKYVDVTGGGDVYTASPSPALTAYLTGQGFALMFSVANTSTGPTLNISGLGAKALTKNSGATLSLGDIGVRTIRNVIYTGASFEITNPPSSLYGVADGGLKTSSFVAAVNTRYRFKNYTQSNAVQQPTGSAGDVIILACYGPYAPLLCGTINGVSQTIAIAPNQTVIQTYSSTVGWS